MQRLLLRLTPGVMSERGRTAMRLNFLPPIVVIFVHVSSSSLPVQTVRGQNTIVFDRTTYKGLL